MEVKWFTHEADETRNLTFCQHNSFLLLNFQTKNTDAGTQVHSTAVGSQVVQTIMYTIHFTGAEEASTVPTKNELWISCHF